MNNKLLENDEIMKLKLFNNLFNLLNSNDIKSYNLFKSLLNNNIELRKQFLKQMFKYHKNYNEIDFDKIESYYKYGHVIEWITLNNCIMEYRIKLVSNSKNYDVSITICQFL